MKIVLLYLFTLLITILASPALAEEKQGWFLGTSYSYQSVSFEYMDDHNLDSLGLIAGYQLDDILSFEYRLNSGISSDSFPLLIPANFDNTFKHEIDYQMSILVKAAYQIGLNFSVYGLAGFSITKSHITSHTTEYDFQGNEISSWSRNYSEKSEGITYGLGVIYQLTKKVNLFVDYQVLPDFDSSGALKANWHSTTAGVNYSF